MNKISVDIDRLRSASRKLLREWGILKLFYQGNLTPSHVHTLLEIRSGAGTITELSERLVLDISTVSRIVDKLLKEKLIVTKRSVDKRAKTISLTKNGLAEAHHIDRFSNKLIIDAFAHITPEDQNKIFQGVELYATALEKSRGLSEDLQIRTLKRDKLLRNKIVDMIIDIQNNELNLNADRSINNSIINAESFYNFQGKCNFWYAVDKDNKIAGCIGLKYISENCAELNKCFVASPFRGKGLSQRLISKLVIQAYKLNIQEIYLGTVDYFVWAHRFYKKLGFKEIPIEALPKGFEPCPVDSVFFCGKVNELMTVI